MKIIIYVSLFIVSFDASGQYPVIVDSIIIQNRGEARSIVIDNKNGERREYHYNKSGEIQRECYYSLSDVLETSLVLFIDSTVYLKDSAITFFLTYSIENLSLMEMDTLSGYEGKTKYRNSGDTSFWTTGNNTDHILVTKNNEYTYYQGIYNSGREFSNIWYIKHYENKVFFIHESYMEFYVLVKKKGQPDRIERFDFLPREYRNIDNPLEISDYADKSPSEKFKIYYCGENGGPPNKIRSKKTIKSFKKSIYWE